MHSIKKFFFYFGTLLIIAMGAVSPSYATIICETWSASVTHMSGAADTYFDYGDVIEWSVIFDDESTMYHTYEEGVEVERYSKIAMDPYYSNFYLFVSDSEYIFNGPLLDWITATSNDATRSSFYSVRLNDMGWTGGFVSTSKMSFFWEEGTPSAIINIFGQESGSIALYTGPHLINSTPVPEPAITVLMGIGLVCFLGSRRRKKKK